MRISKTLIVQEQDQTWESWGDENLKKLSPILWETLLSADKTASHGVTMGICKILPSDTLIRHQHAQEEAYYILSGEGLMEIDGQAQTVTVSTAVFIPGNAEHAITNSSTQTLQFLYVFPIDSFKDVEYEFTQGSY